MYKVGDIIKGVVTGIEDYGIFVNLENNFSGLIHISEITQGFVNNINKYVSIGDYIYVYVLDIDKKKNHLNLSIKNINYKYEDETKKIKETLKGFLPLSENLDKWIETKLNEIDDQNM